MRSSHSLAAMFGVVVFIIAGCSGDPGPGEEAGLSTEEELRGGNALIGISDEDPNSMSPTTNPWLDELHDKAHVRSARKIIPYDIMDQPGRAEIQSLCAKWAGCAPRAFADWLENVSVFHNTHPDFAPYVTVSFWNGTAVNDPVPMPVFKDRIRRLFEAYGGEGGAGATVLGKPYLFYRVKYWGFLNESDGAPAFTRHDPRLAARYFLAAREVAQKHCKGCVLVAGEFARADAAAFGANGYITEYFDEIKAAGVEPHAVSMHAYGDVNDLHTAETRRFLKRAKSDFPGAQVWLSEEGVILHEKNGNPGHPERQEKAANTFMKLAHFKGVDRAYYYEVLAKAQFDAYQGPGSWDSALVDENDRPRAAMCVLTGSPEAAECNGSPFPSPFAH